MTHRIRGRYACRQSCALVFIRPIHSVLAILAAQLQRELQTPATFRALDSWSSNKQMQSMHSTMSWSHATHLLHKADEGNIGSLPVGSMQRLSYQLVRQCAILQMQSQGSRRRESAYLTGLLPCCFSEISPAHDDSRHEQNSTCKRTSTLLLAMRKLAQQVRTTTRIARRSTHY